MCVITEICGRTTTTLRGETPKIEPRQQPQHAAEEGLESSCSRVVATRNEYTGTFSQDASSNILWPVKTESKQANYVKNVNGSSTIETRVWYVRQVSYMYVAVRQFCRFVALEFKHDRVVRVKLCGLYSMR